MKEFYCGLHHPSDAWPFERAMISVNALLKRRSGFKVNKWIMDSGAFSQIAKHGKHVLDQDQYLEYIHKFSEFGEMVAAVCQDWMCEPFILNKTGFTIGHHQEKTLLSYVYLQESSDIPILPVLQGFHPEDYVCHVRMYGDWLKKGAWVGVGSVCKRNSNPDAIEDVLLAIKAERPDLRLHGFGLKLESIERGTVRALLHSSDSMAWTRVGFDDADSNDPRLALRYAAKVEKLIEHPVFHVQEVMTKWWN
jgi:hypothetical protein